MWWCGTEGARVGLLEQGWLCCCSWQPAEEWMHQFNRPCCYPSGLLQDYRQKHRQAVRLLGRASGGGNKRQRKS